MAHSGSVVLGINAMFGPLVLDLLPTTATRSVLHGIPQKITRLLRIGLSVWQSSVAPRLLTLHTADRSTIKSRRLRG